MLASGQLVIRILALMSDDAGLADDKSESTAGMLCREASAFLNSHANAQTSKRAKLGILLWLANPTDFAATRPSDDTPSNCHENQHRLLITLNSNCLVLLSPPNPHICREESCRFSQHP